MHSSALSGTIRERLWMVYAGMGDGTCMLLLMMQS